MQKIPISIVIPVYNEQENIKELVCELEEKLTEHFYTIEIVFVDDCSTDLTLEIIDKIDFKLMKLKLLKNEKNCGQGISLIRGINAAENDIVITIDGDLQVEPLEIIKMVKLKTEKNYDFICSHRNIRQDGFITKHLPSILGNKLISLLFGTNFKDIGSSLKVLNKRDFINVTPFRNIHRYISIILHIHGRKSAEVVISHRKRTRGVSSYSSMKFIGVLIELVQLKLYLRKSLKKYSGNF